MRKIARILTTVTIFLGTAYYAEAQIPPSQQQCAAAAVAAAKSALQSAIVACKGDRTCVQNAVSAHQSLLSAALADLKSCPAPAQP